MLCLGHCSNAFILSLDFNKEYIRAPSLPRISSVPWTSRTSLYEGTLDGELTQVDALLISALEREDSESTSYFYHSLTHVSNGIRTWRTALTKGRMPVPGEFVNGFLWPDEPLFSKIEKNMSILQLPRFALRHPETVSAILLSIIRLSIRFTKEINRFDESVDENEEPGHIEDYEIGVNQFVDHSALLNVESFADEYSSEFMDKWASVVEGVGILDQLFGFDHGLLRMEADETKGPPVDGFGLEDGVWKHSGWKVVPRYQRQLASMPELKKLVRELGRRPTADKSDRMHKFNARKANKDGGMGAEMDPQNRESVSGVTLSSSFTEMLPSEAVLLRSSVPSVRRLFLQKHVESKLLSYELAGWTDVPSVPVTRPLRKERRPSAPGGPIIVCLDTSWSMSSRREDLSKAAVLACVSAAHSQKRDCQVIAFSTERNIMEATSLAVDSKGIPDLLDFLSNSFGGGTDVTGALKFAMDALESGTMSAADILLVTDGEIPDPPVPPSMMESLEILKSRNGVEVHGLLVGKSESKPLSRLCTHVHDFLSVYETMFISPPRSSSRTRMYNVDSRHDTEPSRCNARPWGRKAFAFALHARRSFESDEDWERRPNRSRRKRDTNHEDVYDVGRGQRLESDGKAFLNKVDSSVRILKEAAAVTLSQTVWNAGILEKERQATGSCWRYKEELQAAIDKVGEGLVERSEEARLVVLAMLATEHILLLGVPGTGKSVLGRRLSVLCDGTFFQRLLTRFTTPEELFGPLSLRSLENDEYRRVTAGYLPSASVAFLDEIFKSNSSILNTLLTILNERKFDNAGGQENCPIRCVVGASNELPDSDELNALYDRFLIRKEVVPVSDEGLVKLLSLSNSDIAACDVEGSQCGNVFPNGLDDVVADLASTARSVAMGPDACALVCRLREFLREELNAEISDRRLVKASMLLKISAASHGRARVDPIDCMLLQRCVWQVPEHRVAIKEWLWENIAPGSSSAIGEDTDSITQLRFLLSGLRQEALMVVRTTNGDVTGEGGARESDLATLKSVASEIGQLVAILDEKKSNLARHAELLNQSNNYLWLDPDEAEAMKQLFLPQAKSVTDQFKDTLLDAVALSMSIQSQEYIADDIRLEVIEALWDDLETTAVTFSEDELRMSMKEAKSTFDGETFRKWKRARKKMPLS